MVLHLASADVLRHNFDKSAKQVKGKRPTRYGKADLMGLPMGGGRRAFPTGSVQAAGGRRRAGVGVAAEVEQGEERGGGNGPRASASYASPASECLAP